MEEVSRGAGQNPGAAMREDLVNVNGGMGWLAGEG